MFRLGAIATAVSMTAAILAQQPPRDTRPEPRVGTATISGVVLSDEAQPKRLRRARVTLSGADLPLGQTAITNDDGAFAFERLAAGGYAVTTAKDGYVTISHGATRPLRPGTGIALRDGDTRQITLRMPRGSVITGTITDADGQPAAAVGVSAHIYRYVPAQGERRLAPSGVPSATTDDRGMYRIFGLPEGDYVVMAQIRQTGRVPLMGDLQVLSTAEIRRALEEVRRSGARSQPARSGARDPIATPTAERRRTLTHSPVFYPGTTTPSQAITVTVAKGEERSGIDFQLQYSPTARVDGVVVSPQEGLPRVFVSLTPADRAAGMQSLRSTSAGADGRFAIAGVPPGRYTLMARAAVPRPTGPAATGVTLSTGLWASTEIVIDGQDVTDVALTLQRGLTISGRVVFEGTRPPPRDLTKVRVNVPFAATNAGVPAGLPPVQLDAGGQFTMDGVVPATYHIGGAIQGVRASLGGWWLKSIVVNGRDILDTMLDLRQSSHDAVVTFSDRTSELAGTVRDGQGNPAPEHFVIVFGVQPTSWFANSRRIAGVRPGSDGRYVIHNLPPGDYLIIAASDVDQGEWFDATLLQRLAAGASRITLGEYEQKTHDVRVR